MAFLVRGLARHQEVLVLDPGGYGGYAGSLGEYRAESSLGCSSQFGSYRGGLGGGYGEEVGMGVKLGVTVVLAMEAVAMDTMVVGQEEVSIPPICCGRESSRDLHAGGPMIRNTKGMTRVRIYHIVVPVGDI
ncbi:hypothetical protein B296_00019544 [Ensete ventricosum]|uniref:Uncharacterized protein n=1 Tax=Ensete ventricosum TaxID=4639 RepID=A0A426YL83_ENSVE|nr:hypothetical protein B296_00019544 [Ensete ventricosum]